jgi:hypothetical protein
MQIRSAVRVRATAKPGDSGLNRRWHGTRGHSGLRRLRKSLINATAGVSPRSKSPITDDYPTRRAKRGLTAIQ